jgi:hypothetical protein
MAKELEAVIDEEEIDDDGTGIGADAPHRDDIVPGSRARKQAEPPAKDEDEAAAAEEDAKDKDRKWDRERQQRDQEAANLRKTVEEQGKMVAGLVETLRQQPAGTAAREEKKDELLEQFEALDETAGADELVKALKMTLNFARNADSETKGELKVLAGKLKVLSDQAEAREKRDAEASEESAGKKAVNKMMERLDNRFGAENREAAKKLVKKSLAEAGFDKQNPPDDATFFQHLMEAYGDAKDAAAKKKPATRTAADVALDPGRGGKGIGIQPMRGGYSDVWDSMEKEGKLK